MVVISKINVTAQILTANWNATGSDMWILPLSRVTGGYI